MGGIMTDEGTTKTDENGTVKIKGVVPEEKARLLRSLKLILQAAQQARLTAQEHQVVVGAYKELEQFFLEDMIM